MIFRITPQVIEDALLPEPLHSIPILHLAIADGVAEAVRAAGAGPRQRLLSDVEVEVGHDAGAVLSEPVPLGGGAPRRRLRGGGEGVVDGDDGGGDEAGLHVPREPHLRVPGAVVDDDGGAGQGVHGGRQAGRSSVSGGGGGNRGGAGSSRARGGPLRPAAGGGGGRRSPSRRASQRHHRATHPPPLATTGTRAEAEPVMSSVSGGRSFGKKGGISRGWRAVGRLESGARALLCFGSRP